MERFLLRTGELVAVQGGGTTVEVAGGAAWITQYGDIEDYFVQDEACGRRRWLAFA